MLLDPRFYLALLLAALIGIAGGYSTGYKTAMKSATITAQKLQLATDAAIDAANARTREAEHKAATDLAALDARHLKEMNDAAAKTKNLLERVRTGALRLSMPAHCPTRPAGDDTALAGSAGDEERADLSGTAAEFLIALTAEADDTARQLNAVIDAYQVARTTCGVK